MNISTEEQKYKIKFLSELIEFMKKKESYDFKEERVSEEKCCDKKDIENRSGFPSKCRIWRYKSYLGSKRIALLSPHRS